MLAFQNEALESVCLYLNFPCCYKAQGCLEELSPLDIPDHEHTCPFKIVACVVKKPHPCGWLGSLPTLVRHCQSAHPEAFIETGSEFELNLSCCEEREYVVEYNDSFVLFTKKYNCESKVLEFAVYSSGYTKDFNGGMCQLRVTCGNTTITHDFDTSSDEKIYSVMCLPFLKDDDDDPSLFLAKLRIGDGGLDRERSNIADRVGFTCIYCSNLALPPIYRRTCDMSVICSSCGGAGRRCPVCNIHKRARDRILEQFVVLENYPCMYRRDGCRYVSTHTEMVRHQKFCHYETTECPIFNISCEWSGTFKDVNDHVVREHSEFMVGLGTKVEVSLREDGFHQGVLRFGELLFKTVCEVNEKRLMWVVRPFVPTAQQFNYEISVFDAEDGSFMDAMRQICFGCDHSDEDLAKRYASYFFVEQLVRLKPNGIESRGAIKFSVEIFKR